MPKALLMSARPFDMPNEEDSSKPNNTGVSLIYYTPHTDPTGALNGHGIQKTSVPVSFTELLMKAQLPAVVDFEYDSKPGAAGKAVTSVIAIQIIRSLPLAALLNSVSAPKPA